MFQTKFAEEIKALYAQQRLFENFAVYKVMWKKYCISMQTTNENMCNKVHAHCILDKQRYKHTPRICDTYCFTTATLHNATFIST